MKLVVLAANLVWFLYSAVRTRTWKRSVKNVEVVQEKILFELLSKNIGTVFGQKHSFQSIESVRAFQKSVPIQSYEDVYPYIRQIAEGAQRVLTADPVQRFGVSSGSTNASKLVPYTKSLVTDFQEGIDPWMYHVMRDHAGILLGKSYWSVTPVGEREKCSSGGIPIGFDDEKSYFGKLTQWVLQNVMATPSELSQVKDIDVFRYATLRFLLQEKSLTWMSIWNPTFLTLLLNPLEKWLPQLIEDIRTGGMSVDLGVSPKVDALIRKGLKKSPLRASELKEINRREGINLYQEIWPNLELISCWAHGNSLEAVKELKNYFPNALIQPKGLIATEAMVSFPLRGESSSLSINSHFFEFEEVVNKKIELANQLEIGGKYSVIVTTSGGLYRYRLNDVIEVLGFEAECPLIRFVGKLDKVVDICGEKLNEQFVFNAVGQVLQSFSHHPRFWMVAPEKSTSAAADYTMFVQFEKNQVVEEDKLRSMGQEVDSVLRENFHYDYCRRLGQLGQVRVYLITSEEDANQVYLSVCVELGQRLGDIKSVTLHPFRHWSERFKGRFV